MIRQTTLALKWLIKTRYVTEMYICEAAINIPQFPQIDYCGNADGSHHK